MAQGVVFAEQDADDVLEHARFLIEGLFDEERVVGDRKGLGARRSCAAGEGERARQADVISASTKTATDRTSTSSFEAARAPMVSGSASLQRTRTLSAASSRDSTRSSCPGFRWLCSRKRRNAAS